MDRSKPRQKFQAGQVSCAVWENEIEVNGEPRTMLKATVSRHYKDREGNWKTSQSFSMNEVPKAIFVLFQAYESMVCGSAEDRINGAVEEETI